MARPTRLLPLLLLVTALLAATAAPPAWGEHVPLQREDFRQRFAAFGTGSAVSLRALQAGDARASAVESAFTGQSINSLGLAAPIVNEFGTAVQPVLRDHHAYARGSGLEIGVGTPVEGIPNPNQVVLGGLAEAAAPPATGPVTEEIGPVGVAGLAEAALLRSSAAAHYGGGPCLVGAPLAFGSAEAAGLELGGFGRELAELLEPLVVPTGAQAPDGPGPGVSRTRSLSYLRPNGDGSFGVVSETRQTIAPISLLGGLLTIEVLGEWVLRVEASGGPGGASVVFAPVDARAETPVARVNGLDISLGQLLGPDGLVLDLAPLAVVRIGSPPRAIRGTGPARVSSDGTSAAGAVDLVQVTLADVPTLAIGGADLRLGHMEASAVAPAGGVDCPLPVRAVPVEDPVSAGEELAFEISVPDGGDLRSPYACALSDIAVDAVVSTADGKEPVELLEASDGGVLGAGGSVSWDDLGSFAPGEPPVAVLVRGRAPTGRPERVVGVDVRARAVVGDCNPGVGDALVAQALRGATITGTANASLRVIGGPGHARATLATASGAPAQLPATGGTAHTLAIGSGALLLGALLRRRLRSDGISTPPAPAGPHPASSRG